MAFIFSDSKGIILMDYLEKGKTVNLVYYCALLHRLCREMNEKRPGMQSKKVLFHQANARVHTSVQSVVKIHNYGFGLLPLPDYFSDFTPSKYHDLSAKFSIHSHIQCLHAYTRKFLKFRNSKYTIYCR